MLPVHSLCMEVSLLPAAGGRGGSGGINLEQTKDETTARNKPLTSSQLATGGDPGVKLKLVAGAEHKSAFHK